MRVNPAMPPASAMATAGDFDGKNIRITGNVVAGVIAFGPFGLFMKGSNASLKAGEILNGYTLSDTAFDRPSTP